MPPGASLLMRGLGMRELDKHIKNEKRRRGDFDKFNRPKPLVHTRDGNLDFPPYMTDEDIALLGTRSVDPSHGSLGGLSDDYVWNLFVWERWLQRRQGIVSPFRHVRGRKAREDREFRHWLRTYHDREELERRAIYYDQRYVGADDRI